MLPQFRKPDGDAGRSVLPSMSPPPATPTSDTSPSTLGLRPQSSFRTGAAAGGSVIGPDLIIQGNLQSKGEVQVEGEVQGDIHATHIIIGEKAKITGTIVAEECVIRGHVLGTVRGRRVLLQASSHVEGDVYHQTVAIEQGAFFEGKSRRTEDPLAGTSRSSPASQPQAVPPTPANETAAATSMSSPSPAALPSLSMSAMPVPSSS